MKQHSGLHAYLCINVTNIKCCKNNHAKLNKHRAQDKKYDNYFN